MSLPITSAYQTFLMNPSATYKSQVSAARDKHAARFRTRDGDTVNISQEAYALLENNMTDRDEPPGEGFGGHSGIDPAPHFW